MTAATLVRATLELTLPQLRSAALEMWAAPGLRERYPAYLYAMHGLIRASVPLMRDAVERCAALPPGDPCAEPLAAYLAVHLAEEQDHDAWLLEDLAALGRPPEAVLGRAPAAEVAALAGAQYYWLRHYHPACLLGYIAVLEGCPPDPGVVARLPALTGLPAPAFRTLALHAELDPGHREGLDRFLAELPLPDRVAAAVARSAAFTADRAAALLRGLARADHPDQPDDPARPDRPPRSPDPSLD
ncbi:iron-containing redox enzyme family protein [Streptacidiphilus sp. P02-A3a]|uniref:iron-containing redox enzyme family protein n=1 Tax=Streptacidiphilus sp. P02-A3a TaxID=2704468 RepID=UPI0015F8CE28|nr:iron-containing redox enzyme family protein [Streptacidiphilus sp. P02-A3a]QMU73258.1 iron-containing redox enzyme family protein [Streptacidiphilus sp. P02-A3a]